MLNTWESERNQTCTAVHKAMANHFPPVYVFPGQQPLERGSPTRGLPFNPELLRRHAFQLRNMLEEYYWGKRALWESMYPRATEATYAKGMEALSDALARKIVHQRDFVMGFFGSSVVAAQDNCFHYAYPLQLRRTLLPLFEAAGIDIEIRTSGQNGDGGEAEVQMRCLEAIMGDLSELDIVNFGWWMIRTNPPSRHETIRRLLSRGVLPHFSEFVDYGRHLNEHEKVEYYKLGMMEINGWQNLYAPQWWPKMGRAHWGRNGDGTCHRYTREGALGVLFYNWHPGPAGFQLIADLWAYRYATAFAMAMEKIAKEIQGGDINSLKKRWPWERKGKALPSDPPRCNKDRMASSDAWKRLCEKKFDNGYDNVKCSIGHYPKWGKDANLTSWAVETNENGGALNADKPYHFNTGKWQWAQTKRNSTLGTSAGFHPGCPAQPQFAHMESCKHPDMGKSIVGRVGNGWIGFRLPKMPKIGRITICNKDKRSGYMATDAATLKINLNGKPIDIPKWSST